MKVVKVMRLMCFMVLLLIMPCLAQAAFSSGSTGADGAFEPTANIAVQIPDSGVFNYTTVNISTGVTVTYKKNSTNTPVTVLATGDVTVNGTISVNGISATVTAPGEGGPGGFSGGVGGYVNSSGFRGQGLGGGLGSMTGCGSPPGAGGGSFASQGGQGYNSCNMGAAGGPTYGNDTFMPLVGGSGGGGGTGVSNCKGGAGGGGGGAILIASSSVITTNGAITAYGGNGTGVNYNIYHSGGGGGSGGAIRLIANVITGEGTIAATGGASVGLPTGYTSTGGSGGNGRIRLEAWQINRSANSSPSYSPYLYPVAVNPDAVPSITITQINDVMVASSPAGVFKSPDVTLPYNATGPVNVTVAALNIPAGKTVTVKALPEVGNSVVTGTGTLTGTSDSSSVQIQLNTAKGMAYLLSASVNY